MKIKVQDIVYHANVREVREKVVRVADFAIPSDKIAASLATAAGQLLVSTGSGMWDILAAPGSDGLSLVSDTTLAKKWKTAASTGIEKPSMTNKSGGDLSTGAVVIQDATNDSAFKTTTSAGDNVIAVLAETIANNVAGRILQIGLATVLVQGNVAKGDYLCSSTTAGRAQTAATKKGVFGIAMTAYAGGGAGSVTALIWTQGISVLIGAASGVPTLDGSSLVVQNPANATATPTVSKIPISDSDGKLDGWTTGKYWKQTTGTFTAAPASTSTLTMTSDLTASIKAGMSLKYVIGGTTYYGLVSAIAANLLTVAGAPLSGDVTALYYDGGTIRQVVVTIPFSYEDASNTALLTSDAKCPIVWGLPQSYCVYFAVWSRIHDSHATHGQASVRINATEVNTTAGGLTIAADATWYATVVDIAVAAYDINPGETLEVTAVKGGTGDGQDLCVKMVFVTP